MFKMDLWELENFSWDCYSCGHLNCSNVTNGILPICEDCEAECDTLKNNELIELISEVEVL